MSFFKLQPCLGQMLAPAVVSLAMVHYGKQNKNLCIVADVFLEVSPIIYKYRITIGDGVKLWICLG